ncbi:MAG: hypothetical protein GF365_03985 [Candidatus Buchananbacteria bacterium]|nr:hypothetical protein [Candidatus Buchananbacteria bacterium]
MRKLILIYLMLLAFVLVFTACNLASEPEPDWVKQILANLGDDKDYTAVYKCDYRDQTVYYAISSCCDRYDPLFDREQKR